VAWGRTGDGTAVGCQMTQSTEHLTPRERQCLMAVWETGYGPDAAKVVGISRHTLRTHLQNARSKLGAKTTLEAIRLLLAA
jgi:DNA-binding CsgD family transcriptional regulator